MTDDSMLARVRALLAKAEGASTEHERDAYNAKASELIGRYGIDEALAQATSHVRSTPTHRKIRVDSPFSGDKLILLAQIVEAFGGKSVQLTKHEGGRRVLYAHIFGMASDLDRAEILYTSLLVQAMRELVHARPSDPYESVAAYRRSWLSGFAARVGQRLKASEAKARGEAEGRAAASGTSTEIVLADRAQLTQQLMTEQYPKLGKVRRSRSGSGRAAGHTAGSRADLGGGRVTGAGRAALR